MQTTRTPYSISFMATVLLLLLFACHSTVANAAVALGATRVIYPAKMLKLFLLWKKTRRMRIHYSWQLLAA